MPGARPESTFEVLERYRQSLRRLAGDRPWFFLLILMVVAPLPAAMAGLAAIFFVVHVATGNNLLVAPLVLVFLPLGMLLTIHGMIVYVLACAICFLAGAAMTGAAIKWPLLRPMRWWVAVGAFLGGVVLPAILLLHRLASQGQLHADPLALVGLGALAGAVSAFVYRLIMGFAIPTVEQANPPAPPSA